MLALLVAVGCAAPQRPDGGRGLLPAGSGAPAVAGVDQNGVTRRLDAEHGKYVVVYFYPKDGTPGCTKEACAFRDVWSRYEAAGVRVYGVSADDVESHKRFAEEHRLPFALIADDRHAWAEAFGVSSTFGFDARVTFVIDPSGTIARVYPDVDPGLHAETILGDIRARTP